MAGSLARGVRELLLPPCCAGCGAPGTHWCPTCSRHLQTPPRRIHTRAFVPCPVWSLAPYSGPVAAGIVGFKEDRRRELAAPFGEALAQGAAALVELGELLHPAERPWVLIPVPSTEQSVRERGFAHMSAVAEACAAALPAVLTGAELGGRIVAQVLASQPHADAVGLTAEQRRENLAGTISADTQLVGELRAQLEALGVVGWPGESGARVAQKMDPAAGSATGAQVPRLPKNPFSHCEILLIDDVATTGATLAECFFALYTVGLRPRGALTLASA